MEPFVTLLHGVHGTAEWQQWRGSMRPSTHTRGRAATRYRKGVERATRRTVIIMAYAPS